MNEENEFRFKKNIRDFLNNLNKQFDKQKKINKKLKNVLINRKFKFKFKLRFNKINNNNKKITYIKLKNNVQNNSINFEMFLNNVIIIWQFHDFNDLSNNIKLDWSRRVEISTRCRNLDSIRCRIDAKKWNQKLFRIEIFDSKHRIKLK